MLVKTGWLVMLMVVAASVQAAELKNGAVFTLSELPSELTVRQRRGGASRFLMEEANARRWTAEYSANECEVEIEHRESRAAVKVAKKPGVEAPSLVVFRHGERQVRLVVYSVGEAVDFRYPQSRVIQFLKTECARRGIELVDWHVHIRGGLTPEMAAERGKLSGIRQSAMENHGREWEIFGNEQLVKFADRARRADPRMPVGIQVNDRDWFRQIDASTRSKFDYILADTMIMGKLPNGRDRRLWLVKDIAELGDIEKWMDDYVAMNLRILDEPISILANPTYLPSPLNSLHDRLWTEARMKKVIAKAVERGIALEIQAESPYPTPRFLKLAKAMGAKFTFGTNNYDAAPKDLSRWLEAIMWLDLRREDIWTPKN